MMHLVSSKVIEYAVAVIALGLTVLLLSNSASALSGGDFQRGRIIDDGLFYDGDTMTVSDIQDFLDDMVGDSDQIPDGIDGSCDTNGDLPSEFGGGTRAQYAASNPSDNVHNPPYICLNEYYENTATHENNLRGDPVPSGAKSAAEIIHDVAVDQSINPRVLLVLLQKEQILVTDDWPVEIQYRSATGYGCPDSAPCDEEYYGFYNQVYRAAWQFNLYKNNPNSYSHRPFQTNNISYQANTPSCGTRSVFIENYSTAGLYNYTPYTPNDAALDNLYGTGNSCSAYGNRNFWRYYADWFGATLTDHTPPRIASPAYSFSRLVGPAPAKTPATGSFGEHISTLYTGTTINIFYYESSAGELHRSWYASGSWNHEVIDGDSDSVSGKIEANVGMHIDSIYDSTNEKVHLFYYDSTNQSLRHAVLDETSGTWLYETLEGSNGILEKNVNTGLYASAVIYSSGNIHVYYYDKTNGNLRHAWYKHDRWKFETLDGSGTSKSGYAGIDTGLTPSAIMNGSVPHIYYYDKTNGNLRHAWYKHDRWKFETINGSSPSRIGESKDTGLHPKPIYLNGVPYVFYFNPDDASWSFVIIHPTHGWSDYDLDGSVTATSGNDSPVGGDIGVAHYDSGGSIHVFYKANSTDSITHAWTSGH